MNLGELRGAIRTHKGNVGVTVPGIGFVLVQKGSLMDALGQQYGSRTTETGLRLNAAGEIVSTSGSSEIEGGCCDLAFVQPEQLDLEDAIAAAAGDDLDDLL